MVCGECYDKLAVDPTSCFGRKYDKAVTICNSVCPDRTMCARYKKERIAPLRTLTLEGRRAALELLTPPPKTTKLYDHPFPSRASLIRVCFEFCVKGTTLHYLERECRRVRGDYDRVLKLLRNERQAQHRWIWNEDGGNVKIDWNGK